MHIIIPHHRRGRPRRGRVIVVLGVLSVLALGVGLFAWVSHGPLAGTKTHDFGSVLVPVEGVTLHHIFTLTNRTGHELLIGHVSSTCGCTQAKLSTERVKPGERVEVAVDFTIKAWTHKFANIGLELGEKDGVVTLTVAATGKKAG